MAKIKGPMLAHLANGTFAKLLVFGKSNGTQTAYIQKVFSQEKRIKYLWGNQFGLGAFGRSNFGDVPLATSPEVNKKMALVVFLPSTKQQLERQAHANAAAVWQKLAQHQKEIWTEQAAELGLTGFNLFLKEYLNQN